MNDVNLDTAKYKTDLQSSQEATLRLLTIPISVLKTCTQISPIKREDLPSFVNQYITRINLHCHDVRQLKRKNRGTMQGKVGQYSNQLSFRRDIHPDRGKIHRNYEISRMNLREWNRSDSQNMMIPGCRR